MYCKITDSKSINTRGFREMIGTLTTENRDGNGDDETEKNTPREESSWKAGKIFVLGPVTHLQAPKFGGRGGGGV